MAHRLKTTVFCHLLQFIRQLEQNWSTTGAKEAGCPNSAPLCSKNGGKASAPVALKKANNWSRTGADWSSKGAGAPVVYTPLKGGYNHKWSSPPVYLQNWSHKLA